MSTLQHKIKPHHFLGTLFMLAIIMGQYVFQLGFMVYFKCNQFELAERYCVNKDKPKSCCDGKCYLGKQLTQKQPDQKAEFAFKILNLPFCSKPLMIQFNVFTLDANVKYPFVASVLQEGYDNLVKKPPQFELFS